MGRIVLSEDLFFIWENWLRALLLEIMHGSIEMRDTNFYVKNICEKKPRMLIDDDHYMRSVYKTPEITIRYEASTLSVQLTRGISKGKKT